MRQNLSPIFNGGLLIAICLLLAASSAPAQTTNFTQAFPGISQAGLQSDLANVNANASFTPANLLAFMSSNYFNALPAGQPYLFDGITQTGTLNGTLTATGQVVSAPIVPDKIAQPWAAGGKVSFAFLTVSNHSYTVSANADLTAANWNSVSNFTGDGYVKTLTLPITNGANFYRVGQP